MPYGDGVIRQALANQIAEKNKAGHNVNRAKKYANIEKEKIGTREDVEKVTRGSLSKEFNKSASKENEI